VLVVTWETVIQGMAARVGGGVGVGIGAYSRHTEANRVWSKTLQSRKLVRIIDFCCSLLRR